MRIPFMRIVLIVALGLFNVTLVFAATRIELTGAIATGTPDHEVPAWQGGLPYEKRPDSGHHQHPFPDEKPLFVIDINNYQQHQEKLSKGLIAMLKRYPESFNIPIYKSHRSARYPDWLYQTMKSGSNARLSENGNAIEDAIPGINFPTPQNGLEAIWNHLTRWRGRYMIRDYAEAIIYQNGSKKLSKARQEVAYDLFRPRELHGNNTRPVLLYYTSYITAPANLAGGALLVIDFLNQHQNPRKSWSYDVAQRRVKRLPYITYDDPAIMAESLRTADDTDMFNGAPDRYSWILRGRETMYIPYNNYSLSDPQVSYDELLPPHHINPKLTRFEAHRVWVVDAILKTDKYHIYTKRTFYIDEDSWSIAIADQYDQEGKIWRVSLAYLKNYYEVPVTFSTADAYHDLKTGNYHVGGLTNEEKNSGQFFDDMPNAAYFTPAALRARLKR